MLAAQELRLMEGEEEDLDPGNIDERAYLYIIEKGWNRKKLSYVQFTDVLFQVFYRAIPEGKELTFKDKDAWRENWMDRHHLRYGRILSKVQKQRFNEEWAKSRLLLSPELSLIHISEPTRPY